MKHTPSRRRFALESLHQLERSDVGRHHERGHAHHVAVVDAVASCFFEGSLGVALEIGAQRAIARVGDDDPPIRYVPPKTIGEEYRERRKGG